MTEDRDPTANRKTTSPGKEPQLDLANSIEIAAWIAEAAATGIIGGAAFAYVESFRRRFGERRIDELKSKVYDELKRVKRKPNVSDADLHLRVDRLFDDNRGG